MRVQDKPAPGAVRSGRSPHEVPRCGRNRTVLRRVASVVVLAGVGVMLGLPLLRASAAGPVASRGAVRLVSATGTSVRGQWQSWANASRVPTVTGVVTLRLTGCPGLPNVA